MADNYYKEFHLCILHAADMKTIYWEHKSCVRHRGEEKKHH